MSTQKQSEPQVLIRASSSGLRPSHKTHDLSCRWASSGNTGEYVAVPVSKVPPTMGHCRHCGGGPR